MKPAYSKQPWRTQKQFNKTLYLKPEDVAIWEEAAKLLPYHYGQSVSQFCNSKIRDVVQKLRTKKNGG